MKSVLLSKDRGKKAIILGDKKNSESENCVSFITMKSVGRN